MTKENALVVGATSLVGRFLVDRLRAEGVNAIGLCRTPPAGSAPGNWIAGDLQNADDIRDKLPVISSVYSVGPIHLLAKSLSVLAEKGTNRVIAFSSSSAGSKQKSEIAHERIAAQQFIDGERQTIEICEAHGIPWTILRPTLIYVEGFDKNVSRIARFIQRFRFFPLAGRGDGLRQPVHGADLAAAAVTIRLVNGTVSKIYDMPGGETLPYAEMVGRIFDGLNMPRRIVRVPVPVWKLAFLVAGLLLPGATSAMGNRMSEDLVFDATSAARDFGWTPRAFYPSFATLPGATT
jgi:nucleoside-diphosphate-sugar epimerase